MPERKYQQRLKALEEHQRRTRPAEPTVAKPATERDHSRGLEVGFKHYQGLDIAQSRAMKRRENALRQIARWRDGLGGNARALSDRFIAEEPLAKRYGAAPSAADTESPPIRLPDLSAEAAPPLAPARTSAEAPLALASSGEAAETSPPVALGEERQEANGAERYGAAPFLADTEIHAAAGESIAAAPPTLLPDLSAAAAPSLAPAEQPAAAALPPPADKPAEAALAPAASDALASYGAEDTAGEAADAAPLVLPPDLPTAAAPSLAPTDGKPEEAALTHDSSGEAAQPRPPVASPGEEREERE